MHANHTVVVTRCRAPPHGPSTPLMPIMGLNESRFAGDDEELARLNYCIAWEGVIDRPGEVIAAHVFREGLGIEDFDELETVAGRESAWMI